jgi:hypothetical protein
MIRIVKERGRDTERDRKRDRERRGFDIRERMTFPDIIK